MLREKRKYETWEIPRFVGRTISGAGGAGGGEGGEGLVDFKKNMYMYTVYPGSAHR